MTNLSMASKNHPQNQTQPELRSVFSRTFKVQKTPNINFPHQMEQFHTNISYFGGLNQCQQHISFSTTEIRRPLSFSSLD